MNKIVTLLRESRLARFLIPVGIIFIVVGVVLFVVTKQNQDYIETESEVTKVVLEQEAYTDSDGQRVDETYTVTVKYTVNGKEYTTDLNGMGKSKEGEKIKIYYNPADPSQITQTKSLIFPLIFIAAGAAALVGGIVSAVNAVKRIRKMKEQEKEWANG